MKPVVLILADRVTSTGLPKQIVYEKYVTPIVEIGGALPWVLPALPEGIDVAELLPRIDGVLLPGSVSNIEPWRYGAEPADESLRDPARDHLTSELVPAAVARGIPVFGICRGLQEMNVALGGSLHQDVRADPRFHAHPPGDYGALPIDEQYAPVHHIELVPGGWLAASCGGLDTHVNSLHGQAIDRLAPGAVIEATAADGMVEAIAFPDAAALTFAVQWHPEWDFRTQALNRRLFELFGAACRR
ncbi:MAG: gamma-glutamyl-gamma-aminobutyrate hydrolase family protein [Gammaproteobacteria bacterium]|nr:gamma-glutamyl-gamma-aminobutyrate hydrolase family protein [Gammaproteobacteria bacterium]MBI5617368.1 gamma-glutamyl-gamma-aminobutyrate hydrolase family protein [Gammaproteobacteria bacterium]